MTLFELMLYGGLSALVLLIIFTLATSTIQTNLGAHNRIDTENDFIKIENMLRRTFQQAIRVSRYQPSLPENGQVEGWIRSFDSTAAGGTNTELLALFRFEGQRQRATTFFGFFNIDSVLKGAGLYYFRPRLEDGVQKEGVLLLARQPTNAAILFTDRVRPQYSTGLWAGRISAVRIPDNQIITRYSGIPDPSFAGQGPQRIASFSIDVTLRIFNPSVPLARRCYQQAANCPAGFQVGSDRTRRITISLRNNEFGMSPTMSNRRERLYGPIYFFHSYGGGYVSAN